MNDEPKDAAPHPSQDDVVLTPGGRRARNLVHRVPPGQAVRHESSGDLSVVSQQQAHRSSTMPTELVLTPGGFRHPSLVHRVESGHALHVADGKVRMMNLRTKALRDVPEVFVRPGEVPGFGSGWITYAYWLNTTSQPVTEFRSTWQVPPAPTTQSGQTIFLFNGIDPVNPSAAILQPVLQWGVSAAGGGSYWSVASWYVLGNGQAFHTNLVPVSVGDTIAGVMTLESRSGGLFNYKSEFQGIAGTALPIQNVAELVWCNETLEAYDITACSDYPDADLTAMAAIDLKTGTATPPLSWNAVNNVTDCGQHTRVVSNSVTNGEVDLYYRDPIARVFELDRFSKSVRILFGVTNGGEGIGILPNGHIIRIPPHNPLLREIGPAITDLVRGLAVHADMEGSTNAAGVAVSKAGLALARGSLEAAAQAIKSAIE